MKKLIALLCIAALMCAAGLCETAGRELTNWFGQDIARAAEELGGLTFRAGDEFAQNYEGDAFVLRGNGGVVTDIELRDTPSADSLCGVSVGMSRDDVIALMTGCPMLWEYDEELAYTMRVDPENELNNETLVVFFDENATVNGAWYRASEA